MSTIQKSITQDNELRQKQIAASLFTAFEKRVSLAKSHNIKITQSLVASKLGMSQSLISQYLKGDIPIPDHKMRILSDFLRVDAEKLNPRLRNIKKKNNKRKKKLFILDTGSCGMEWQKSKAHYEDFASVKIGTILKYTGDIVLHKELFDYHGKATGNKIYEHDVNPLTCYLHIAHLDVLSIEELKNVKIIANWRWADIKNQMPEKFVFMDKTLYEFKMKELASEPIFDLRWKKNWGPPFAILNIIMK